MCGIVGFYDSARPSDTFPDTICRMLSMIRHRGPDEMGYFFDERVALGTARLSIIDLLSGQQPLSDPTGRYWITYNGEVYNYIELRAELERLKYRFVTSSDTEVVLNAYIAWKHEAFAKLNGGFAFAIYDRWEETLVLVRDRYGKRPLYYSRCDKEWVFASEIKCFLAHGGVKLAFDKEQLCSIFTLWTPLPHESGYQGIYQVPPASYIRLKSDGTVESHSYYTLDFQTTPFAGSEEEAAQRTRDTLSESVRLRLRSDVEVGTYLSGGLDSSITTLLATQHSPYPVRTFSISFEEASFDESETQDEVSRYLGTQHTALKVSNAAIAEAFPDALWHAEVPLFRTAFVPMYLLSQEVQKAGIKVVLTGEGADESFLGYNIFKETLLRQRWLRLSAEEKASSLAKLYPYQKHFQTYASALSGLYNQFSQERIAGLFSHEIRFHNTRFTSRLLNRPPDGLAAIRQTIANAKEFNQLSTLQRAQWLEFKTLLAGYLLSSQGDRMSFAHGVESRMPFLDPNVVRWACSLPTSLKLRGGNDEKYILKRAFRGALPETVLAKPKQPYRAPDVLPFLHGRPPDYLEALLSERELSQSDFLDVRFAQRLVKKLMKSPPSRISQRESQTFVFLLSLALLHQMMGRRTPNSSQIQSLIVRRYDGRARKNHIS